MLFWALIIGLALIVAAILGRTVLRARAGAEHPAAYDLRVYRDQLKEVDRDLARGILNPGDAERVRTEISRRILAADAKLQAGRSDGGQPARAGWALASLAVAGLIGGSAALYVWIGAPGAHDLPLKSRIAASDAARAARLSQAEAEARMPAAQTDPNASQEFLDLMEKLRQTVDKRPDDLQGLTLLARNEAALGNLAAAHAAQSRIIDIKGPEATAGDYAHYADLMISAAGGYVSSEAETALRAALQRDPSEPRSRYYLGLYLLQVDRPDGTFRLWESLLNDSRPDAPWVPLIRSQIEEIAWRAGVKYDLPPLPETSGPTGDDIEAASQMSAEERDAMVRGMVEGLSERLATEGGTPREWARLIGALGVLGETDRARAVRDEAQEVFAGQTEALALIASAASRAGIAE